MEAELATVHGAGPRWRFSVGCVRAAGLIRARAALTSRERGGASLRAAIATGLVAAIALAGYGLVRYPGLRSADGAGLAAVTFAGVLLAYGAVTLTLSRGTGLPAAAARRSGIVGGVTIGAAWLIVLSPTTELLKEWVLAPLLVALLAPIYIAARAGSRAALWSGIVGALVVFTVSMTAAYLHDGRPYDAQLLRDFHHSGAPDLATLSVTDDLGSALTLLILIPLTALAFGSLGARLFTRRVPS